MSTSVQPLAFGRHFALLRGLRAFVEAHAFAPTLGEEFKTFAAELVAGSKGIRNLSVAPGGVQRYVYPLRGNEIVLGHNLLKDSRPNVRAVEAMPRGGMLTLNAYSSRADIVLEVSDTGVGIPTGVNFLPPPRAWGAASAWWL